MNNSNKSSELFYSKVALLLKEKKYIEAKNLIINSANTLEKDARYYFYLGLANKFLTLYDEALENFQQVLIENKNYVNCYIQIASIMDIKRNYSKEIESLKIAQKIASKSNLTIKIGKQTFYKQLEMPLRKAYAYTSKMMTINMMAMDAKEGISAFLEKRKPIWKNK